MCGFELSFTHATRSINHSTHKKTQAKADKYEEEGRGFMSRAAPLRPRLPSTLASHLYYKTRLDLARTQRRMENEFGRDFFTEVRVMSVVVGFDGLGGISFLRMIV